MPLVPYFTPSNLRVSTPLMATVATALLPDTTPAKIRERPCVNHDLHLDLKLSSEADFNLAIQRIEQARQKRTNVPATRTTLHFDHIECELNDIVEACKLSVEHLELYRDYMLRHPTDTLPKALETRRRQLLAKIEHKLADHPLSKTTRSGDMSSARAVTHRFNQRTPKSPRRRASTKKFNQSVDSGSASYIKTPLRRRRQMCAMLGLNFFTGPSIIFVCLCLFMYLCWPYSMYIALIYFTSIVFLDRCTTLPRTATPLWRNSSLFRLFRNYFPIRIVKSLKAHRGSQGTKGTTGKADTKEIKGKSGTTTGTTDTAGTTDNVFDPAGNYLFCYHPHGVQSAGAFIMASRASGFDELFPGLQLSVQTLSINFKTPVFRENCIGLGMGDASKQSIMNALTRAPGSCAALVTGGAKESMLAQPYSSKVVLNSRYGFVKVAIKAGANLVPMWGFGENNLYENMAIGHPWVQKWQRRIQRLVTFAPLLVQGRGVFSYSSGLVPHRRPITTVVGVPIVVEKDANPSREKVQKYHALYKKAVLELFNNYRDIYDPKANDVEFVD